MVLALFAVWCFAVAFAGGLVGLVLGNLRLPATLLVAASAPAATGANLLVSAVAAGTASIAHIRAGRINVRLFAWMVPPSVAGAVTGGYLSTMLPKRALLGFIAVVLAFSAVQLLRGRTGRPPRRATDGLDIRAAVLSGAAIGVLGGVVGLILGSLRMPALLRLVGEAPARAAGTNVAVGFFVGIAGALGHLPGMSPDWTVAAVGSAASVPGALLGARLTGRLDDDELVRAIAIVLLIAAVATGVQAIA